MILIDAIYINNSGGKVLLDYLMTELERTDKSVFYLLDERVKGNIVDVKPTNRIVYAKSSLLWRWKFYRSNKNLFSSVLCFGNLPPNIKIRAKVYTYFHQLLFLALPNDMSLLTKMVYRIKMQILASFKKNTDIWWVQTDVIKQRLAEKYNIAPQRIELMPFYPPFEEEFQNVVRKKNQYIYVSNAPNHKNHIRLIEAFCTFYDKTKIGNLVLTIPDGFIEILELIESKRQQGYPINNVGFVPRNELRKLYKESEYQIYPSLSESFGLGLVEAIENGCKIIGADLPYTFAVCEPSLIFNPLDKNAIVEVLLLSLSDNILPSKLKVSNQIKQLIEKLK